MLIRKVHHVAYRCNDAKETVDWYEQHLGMNYITGLCRGPCAVDEANPIRTCTSSSTRGTATFSPSSNCPTSPPWGATEHAGVGAAPGLRSRLR